jgi:hypothetical protein
LNFKTGEWSARCGLAFKTKKLVKLHQPNCQDCRNLAWKTEEVDGKLIVVEHKARCGLLLDTYRSLVSHQRECTQCESIKRANIKSKNLKTNQSDGHRVASSKTARLTSARPEIQAARAENLRKWREANPEAFAKCVEAAMRSPKRSKMETWLRLQLGWDMARIRCKKTKIQKQVDLVKGKVWIEVDGFYHFLENPHVGRKQTLQDVQQRDLLLKNEAIRRGDITLLRLGMECFASSTGAMKLEWYQLLQDMLASPIPGVWCFGKLYESCPWASEGCTILKSPHPPTTSC